MNIFILDADPTQSVKLICDIHLNKQILEIAQIICTVLHTRGQTVPYKPTHKNHPVTLWAGDNLDFCIYYSKLLSDEYEYRFNKVHKSYTVIASITPKPYPCIQYTPFPIRNDLEYIKEKYKSWSERPKPLIPKWTKGLTKRSNIECNTNTVIEP